MARGSVATAIHSNERSAVIRLSAEKNIKNVKHNLSFLMMLDLQQQMKTIVFHVFDIFFCRKSDDGGAFIRVDGSGNAATSHV
jgi:hypothetical protein